MNLSMRRVGLIGWPLKHSLSPLIHQFWMQKAGLQEQLYELLPTPKDRLTERLRTLSEEGFIGCNITVPYKEAVFTFLCEYGNLDAETKRLQAVNTVLIDEKGIMQGRNSDGIGFLANLDKQLLKWRSLENARKNPVVIFGAGGAARSILAALVDCGMEPVFLINRTKKRAEKLLQDLQINNGKAFGTSPEALRASLKNAWMLVNSTSLGMTGVCNWQEGIGIKPSEFLTFVNPAAIIVDIVYAPLRTELLQTAFEYGFTCVDGLGMLLYQAVPSFEGWFGVRPQVCDELRAILEQTLKNQENTY